MFFKRRQASKPITPRLNNGADNVSEDRQILISVYREVKVNKMIRWSELRLWVSPRGENRRFEMIFRAPGLLYQGFKLLVPSNAARLSALCEWTTMECLFNGTMRFTVQIGGSPNRQMRGNVLWCWPIAINERVYIENKLKGAFSSLGMREEQLGNGFAGGRS